MVPDPAVNSPPNARLFGQRTISAPTEFLGTVADNAPQNLTWSLTLRSDASGTTRTLASGSGAVDAAGCAGWAAVAQNSGTDDGSPTRMNDLANACEKCSKNGERKRQRSPTCAA
jgi:hypothetical protein